MRIDLAASFWLKPIKSVNLMASNSSISRLASSGLPGFPLGLNWLIRGFCFTIRYFFGLPRGRIFLPRRRLVYLNLPTFNALVILNTYSLLHRIWVCQGKNFPKRLSIYKWGHPADWQHPAISDWPVCRLLRQNGCPSIGSRGVPKKSGK